MARGTARRYQVAAVAAIMVQTDARLDGQQSLQLAPQFGQSTISLPLNVEELSAVPAYLVPPDTTSASLTGSAGSYVQEIGPFGDAGAPAGTPVLSAMTTTRPFDAAVQTSTGDPFLSSVDPTASSGAPIVIG